MGQVQLALKNNEIIRYIELMFLLTVMLHQLEIIS